MALKDGLQSLEVRADTISGGTIYGATDISVAAGTIGNAELADSAASGTKVSLEFGPIYTGSPIIGNNVALYGTANATGIANTVVVQFQKAFTAAPAAVLITPLGSVAVGGPAVTGIAAGSFTFIGAGSNVSHAWLAIGSGRI